MRHLRHGVVEWVILGLVLASPASAQQVRTASGSVALGFGYTAESFSNVAGGIRRGTRVLDNVDVTLTVDLDGSLPWKGATLFLYGLGNHGGDPSELVGEAQTISNIEAPTARRLYEAWIEQTLAGGALSVKAGLYDLNPEFDALESASLFVNSSQGIGPNFFQTGRNGPSIFPLTSLALRVHADVTDRIHVQGVVLDGVPGDPHDPTGTRIHLSREDGALMVGEIGYDLGGGDEPRGRVSVGGFYYTAGFEPLDPTTPNAHGGNSGVYALAEHRVAGDAERGTCLIARAGLADPHVNRFGRFLGGGVVSTGLLDARPEDSVGLGVAAATNGRHYRDLQRGLGEPTGSSEIVFEFTYFAPLFGGLWVQPDLQYVMNPDTNPLLANALALGVRIGMSF